MHVDVTNTGKRQGDEVVQMYIRDCFSSVTRPINELKGFQRITLEPNETKTVQIPLKASTLAYWDDKQARLKVEAEPLNLMIGSSSKDIKLTTEVRVQ